MPGHDTALDVLLASAPDELLGAATVARFGPRLPFLLKVLAVDTALSIQVHPTLEQAQAGFAAEDAAGIARDAAERNYRDTNHKPELLCALTPFEALCGLRPVEDTLRLFDSWAVAELEWVRALLAGPDGLRAAFTALLRIDDPAPLVAAVVARAAAVAPDDEWAGVARAVGLVAEDFPSDVGVVLGLLLNHVRLEPGEAIFLGRGHRALLPARHRRRGDGQQRQRPALRAHPKHVDVAEVLKITDFSPLDAPRFPAEDSGFGPAFDPPVPDFALSLIDLDAYKGSCAVGGQGPYIVLCTDGRARVEAIGESVELAPGRAAFVAAREACFTVRGTGRVFAATAGSIG